MPTVRALTTPQCRTTSIAAGRSVTTFNFPQDFKLTWVYEIPVGKGRHFDLGWANYVLGGWQFAGIHNYRSGNPSRCTSPA